MPKGYSDVVNKRTDNVMSKRKRTTKENNDTRNITQKLLIEQHKRHTKKCGDQADFVCADFLSYNTVK